MTELEFNNILAKAVSTFGLETQTMMLFEEMAELQNALCKLRRGRDTADHFCEEIADVLIMVGQMSTAYGLENVGSWMEKKATRLQQRINDYENDRRTN